MSNFKSPKCSYCKKPVADQNLIVNAHSYGLSDKTKVCSEECKVQFQAFLDYTNKYKFLFLGGILISSIICFFHISGVLLLGIIIAIFPFVTPHTIEILGVKKSKVLGRVIGIGISAIVTMSWGDLL